ncbi:alpha/beta hydrolase [Pseudodesulfovibrio sp. JC047]|uniref:alpha/beta hydrolase n=1 Tax=Pseudodesulfovibrio sp. JC047 TaxID=2683199 RepID=UPI0013D01FFE|nr:alpha/beta hydrolase [Pseudodesulfovibrio sp. JC047]
MISMMSLKKISIFFICIGILASLLFGCSAPKGEAINLMPAPAIYSDLVNPFEKEIPPPGKIFYATNRAPAKDGDLAYSSERGGVIRLGEASIKFGEEDFSWEEAKRISLLKNRTDQYPLKVQKVTEYGSLGSSLNPFIANGYDGIEAETTGQEFARQIDQQLATSVQKDIFIYVHGYKVDFNNPILVTAELWHFLGYDGAFIAYSWPATPRTLAYLSDLETAELSSYQFRAFLKYLAQHTAAERIHIIGYSAGTRVVDKALFQLTLETQNAPEGEKADLKIGHVMLIGSDMDSALFASNIRKVCWISLIISQSMFPTRTVLSVRQNGFSIGDAWDKSDGKCPRQSAISLRRIPSSTSLT